MDFAALGYTLKSTGNGVPLCQSCNSPRIASFYDLHNEHARETRMDCSTCHGFSKAN